MNTESRFGEAPTRDERITLWFEATRARLLDQELALELARAEATDDNDRAQLLRLDREKAVLGGRIAHMDELAVHISDTDTSTQIDNLESQAAKLDAALTQQNKTADTLEGQVTFRGGMSIDTDAAILRAKLRDTRDLLLEFA